MMLGSAVVVVPWGETRGGGVPHFGEGGGRLAGQRLLAYRRLFVLCAVVLEGGEEGMPCRRQRVVLFTRAHAHRSFLVVRAACGRGWCRGGRLSTASARRIAAPRTSLSYSACFIKRAILRKRAVMNAHWLHMSSSLRVSRTRTRVASTVTDGQLSQMVSRHRWFHVADGLTELAADKGHTRKRSWHQEMELTRGAGIRKWS